RLPTVFFFNALSPSLIYTLSLHDALPISPPIQARSELQPVTHCQLRKRRGRVMNRNRYSLGLFAVAVLIACGLSPCVGFGSSRPYNAKGLTSTSSAPTLWRITTGSTTSSRETAASLQAQISKSLPANPTAPSK